MSARYLRRAALLLAMALAVIASGRVQAASSAAAPPPDAAALGHEFLASVGAAPRAHQLGDTVSAERVKVAHTLAALPLAFEPNRGQSAPEVRFLGRAPGYVLQLTAAEMRLLIRGAPEQPRRAAPAPPSDPAPAAEACAPATTAPAQARPHALRLTWLDVNGEVEAAAEAPLPGRVNYLKGRDAAAWHTNVPTFERVRYRELYPGIDVVYYGNGRQLEFDLVVAPGADPGRARLVLEGAAVRSTDGGDLDLVLSDGRRLQLRAAVAYQERDGQRLAVAAQYRLTRRGEATEIAFELGAYDRARPLVIDPLVYATFLGGGGQDRGWGIAVSAAGEAFVTGETDDVAVAFPTTPGAFDTTLNGGQDAFVSRLNAAGSALIYSTVLGGTGLDRGLAIAVSAAGEAFVTGQTANSPTPFPTTAGAFDTIHNGGFNDAFVAKLDPTGSVLLYSTFLGGGGSDVGWGIAVNAAGEAFVTGETQDAVVDFPTTPGAFDTSHNGHYDAFVTRLNSAGSALIYSTFLGGSFNEGGYGIAVNAADEAFVTGWTHDAAVPFPTTAGAFSTVHGGYIDAFVVKLDPAGSALVYSTFLGGGSQDEGHGIAVSAAGEAFVTGVTFDAGFPTTAGAFSPVSNGAPDAFVAKLNPTGSALVYSTFLGGSGHDSGQGIAVTAAGEAFVTGATAKAGVDFPTTAGAFSTVHNGLVDAFVAKLDSTGSVLLYSTFLGGSGYEEALAIALTPACDAFVTGATEAAATNFPVTAGAFDTTHNGGPSDAFVAKLSTGACCAPPPPGMVAWYPLNELAGAISILDTAPPPGSTFSNAGTPQPGPVSPPGPPPAGPAPVAGQVGSALYFYGPYIEVPHQAELDFSTGDFAVDTGVTAFTIDAWVRIVQVAPALIQPIADKLDLAAGVGFAFYIRNQRLELVLGGNTFVSTGPPIPFANPLLNTGPWTHVAVTVVGGGRVPGQGVFYIDGLQAGTFTPPSATVNNGVPLWIGKTRVPGPPGELAIDELELFDVALPQSDIQTIYGVGPAGKCPCGVPGQGLDLTVNGSGAGGGTRATVTNPVTIEVALEGCADREMFLVLNAPALGPPIVWSYIDAGGQWIPLPSPLSQITPSSARGLADGTYKLFVGSLPAGQYDLYVACDFIPNGHLDITDAPLCLTGAFDHLPFAVE